MNEIMEQWWIDIGRGNPLSSHRNLSKCHLSIYHNSHMDSHGLACQRTRASVVRAQRLVASDMVGLIDFPIICRPIKKFPFHTSQK